MTARSDRRTPVPRHGEYEYRTVSIARDVSRHDAARMLTAEAEYGRWELATSSLYVGGERRVMLRRRIIRARNTLRAFD